MKIALDNKTHWNSRQGHYEPTEVPEVRKAARRGSKAIARDARPPQCRD